jgi:hypothetical protein
MHTLFLTLLANTFTFMAVAPAATFLAAEFPDTPSPAKPTDLVDTVLLVDGLAVGTRRSDCNPHCPLPVVQPLPQTRLG